MRIEKDVKSKTLTAYLTGDIDHHTALPMREAIDEAILSDKPEKLILDYGDVVFMDSSGIGLIMGRHRLMQTINGKIEVRNVPVSLYKIVRLSGIEKLGKVSIKEEKI